MQASLVYLNFFFFVYVCALCQVFLCDWIWLEASCRAPSLCFCLPLSLSDKASAFTIESENSHQCSGSVCALFNTHRNTTCCTELVFYSVPLTKCQPVNGIAKNISSVCRYCSVCGCPHCCVPLVFNEQEDIISCPCVFADIEDLPPSVQEKLFDEVLDRDVQKGTQDPAQINTHDQSGFI